MMPRASIGCLILATAAYLCACERPFLARDGTVVFQERGARGAAVMTANGLEFRDREDVPARVTPRDPNEPWRAPVGFILPASGRWTETSRPTLVATTGLAIALRPSDTRVPAWGGEVLVRIDVLVPAAAGTARDGEPIALIVDGAGEDTLALADAALAQLGARDHVTVVDTRGARVIVPRMPASHRSLAEAAIEKRLDGRRTEASDPSGAWARAVSAVGASGVRRIVILSDGENASALRSLAEGALASPSGGDIAVSGFATNGAAPDSLDARLTAVRAAVPPAGLVVFRDVVLTFEGTPAPSHVLEASGGDVRWRLEAGELALGDVYAGQMRTEVVRVTVPAWVAGESFAFNVTAHVDDVARGGERRDLTVSLPCVYDDDIERIANSRHGDVIAYASALATLRRLDAAFVGEGVRHAGGLRAVAEMHARSMSLLARDMHDPQISEQAEILTALLAATDP